MGCWEQNFSAKTDEAHAKEFKECFINSFDLDEFDRKWPLGKNAYDTVLGKLSGDFFNIGCGNGGPVFKDAGEYPSEGLYKFIDNFIKKCPNAPFEVDFMSIYSVGGSAHNLYCSRNKPGKKDVYYDLENIYIPETCPFCGGETGCEGYFDFFEEQHCKSCGKLIDEDYLN